MMIFHSYVKLPEGSYGKSPSLIGKFIYNRPSIAPSWCPLFFSKLIYTPIELVRWISPIKPSGPRSLNHQRLPWCTEPHHAKWRSLRAKWCPCLAKDDDRASEGWEPWGIFQPTNVMRWDRDIFEWLFLGGYRLIWTIGFDCRMGNLPSLIGISWHIWWGCQWDIYPLAIKHGWEIPELHAGLLLWKSSN